MAIPITELFAKLGIDVDEAGIGRAATAIGGLKAGLLAVGAAAAGLGVALAGMVKATADHAGKVNDLAGRTGASAGEIQKLGYAASLSGVSMEEMAQAMNFAARKGVKNVGEEIGVVADRIKDLTSRGRGAEAAKLAMDRFGRSGARLVPFLKEGKEKIAELSDEAEALGIVLDDSTVGVGDELGDELDKVNYAFKGLAYTIATPLLEPVKDIVKLFVQWMKANRKLIATRLHAALSLVGKGLKIVWQLAQPVISLIKYLAQNTWILKAALVVLAGVLAAQVGMAVKGLVLALPGLIRSVMGLAAAGTLTGLAWFALAAIIALVAEDIYQFFTGGESLLGRWGTAWSKFLDDLYTPQDGDHWLLEMLKNLGRFLADIPGQWGAVKQKWSALWSSMADTVRYAFKGAWEDIKIWIMEAMSKLPFGLGKKAIGSVFGAGSSPAASTSSAVNAGSPVSYAPQVTQTLNVEQPAGMSGVDFAKMVADEGNKNLEKIFAEARAGVQ